MVSSSSNSYYNHTGSSDNITGSFDSQPLTDPQNDKIVSQVTAPIFTSLNCKQTEAENAIQSIGYQVDLNQTPSYSSNEMETIIKKIKKSEGLTNEEFDCLINQFCEALEKGDAKFVDHILNLTLDLREFSSKVIRRFSHINPSFNFFMERLTLKVPEINEYIDYGPILTPKGVEMIVDYLQAKGSLNMECLVFDNTKSMRETMKKRNNDPDGTKLGILVRLHTTAGLQSAHITPYYLEKREGVWHLLRSDAANDPNEMWSSCALTGALTSCKQFIVQGNRQKDSTSCPVFALRDLCACSKHPDIIGFLENSPLLKPDEYGFNEIPAHALPMHFIKTSQNQEVIDCYNGSEELNIEKHQQFITTKSGENKRVNNLIQQRALKYYSIVIQNVLQLQNPVMS